MNKAFQSENLKKYHDRLIVDFPFFARWCLKIRTKTGSLDSFILNKAQIYLHQQVEHQLQSTGRVRIIILKGRQQGMSTYIGGRFYHKTTHHAGKATFILSHQSDTTEKLFGIVERMHKNVPEPVRMQTDVNNRRRMLFSGLGSEYYVGTAGNDEVGRGGTVQYLHASECAFYPASSGFSKGLLQSVPDAPGTEVFLESTANGFDSLFYPTCMDALQGRGDYKLIFIPWFWQEEYRRPITLDFVRTEAENKLSLAYNLDDKQLNWRRIKIFELKGEIPFMQEYPCSVEESFAISGDSLIPMLAVTTARKTTIENPVGPLIVGADPNEAGGPIGIVWRRGRKIERTRLFEGKKPMEVVAIFADILKNEHPAKMFLDNGNGYGIIDRLIELEWGKIVLGVDFGGGAVEEMLYLNMRAEMAMKLVSWFRNGPVQIPDDDLFAKHLCCVPKEEKTSSNLTKLVPKEIIIKNTLIDPHLFDAAILTFAYPVRGEDTDSKPYSARCKKIERAQSPLKSVQRREDLNRSPSQSVFEAKLRL